MEDKKENGRKRSVNVTSLQSNRSQQKDVSSAQECVIDPVGVCM